jgi:hypothetical protein
MNCSRSKLELRISSLNMLLDRPMKQFSSAVGEPVCFSEGHIALAGDSNGYTLEEQTSPKGAVTVLCGPMSGKELMVAIESIIVGFRLRNDQIGQHLLHSKIQGAGLNPKDFPLYSEKLLEAVRNPIAARGVKLMHDLPIGTWIFYMNRGSFITGQVQEDGYHSVGGESPTVGETIHRIVWKKDVRPGAGHGDKVAEVRETCTYGGMEGNGWSREYIFFNEKGRKVIK